MGVTMKYGPPLTTCVVEHVELQIGKLNIRPRKDFPLSPIKKIITLVLASSFVDMLSLYALSLSVCLSLLSLFICSLNGINYKRKKLEGNIHILIKSLVNPIK